MMANYLIVVADGDEALFIRADDGFRRFEFTDYLNRDTVLAQRSMPAAIKPLWCEAPTAPLPDNDMFSTEAQRFVDILVVELAAFAEQLPDSRIILVVPGWMMSRLRRQLPSALVDRISVAIEKDMTHCSIATIQERLTDDLWKLGRGESGAGSARAISSVSYV